MVDASIGSLRVAVGVEVGVPPVAPLVGLTIVTVGGVVSVEVDGETTTLTQ